MLVWLLRKSKNMMKILKEFVLFSPFLDLPSRVERGPLEMKLILLSSTLKFFMIEPRKTLVIVCLGKETKFRGEEKGFEAWK